MRFYAQHAGEQAVAVAVQDGEQGEHAWQLVPYVRNPSPDAEFIIGQAQFAFIVEFYRNQWVPGSPFHQVPGIIQWATRQAQFIKLPGRMGIGELISSSRPRKI